MKHLIDKLLCKIAESSLARGKWIEALICVALALMAARLPSQEGSGLKHQHSTYTAACLRLPSQEGSGLKHNAFSLFSFLHRLPSQEGSGLKRTRGHCKAAELRLPSQEGSGLKHSGYSGSSVSDTSSLARGKWIEAFRRSPWRNQRPSSLARGKWIEAI